MVKDSVAECEIHVSREPKLLESREGGIAGGIVTGGEFQRFFRDIDPSDRRRARQREQKRYGRPRAATEIQYPRGLLAQAPKMPFQVFDPSMGKIILRFSRGAEALLEGGLIFGGELVESRRGSI